MDNSDIPQINIPGLNSGGSAKSKITLYAAVPSSDPDQAIILGWKEAEGSDIMDSQMEAVGSCSTVKYGLTPPSEKGVWVFEGQVRIAWSRGGPPDEPQDYDSDLSWEGEWRPPNKKELNGWAGVRPKLVGRIGPAPIERLPEKTGPRDETPPPERQPARTQMRPLDPPSRSSDWCACGKHVSECCCGEDHSGPHHPSGRAYYDEEWEQFYK